jgi:hypothetical protein
MIAQLLSIVPVFASRNFGARFGYCEMCSYAQEDLRRHDAELHFDQVGPELSQS